MTNVFYIYDAISFESTVTGSGGSSGGPGACPRWRPEIFFRQYINIITKPTAYDGPWEY